MNIGIVDIDTSHPDAWMPILRSLGHKIVGIWDGGAVHPADYVTNFARVRGVPEVFVSLSAMAQDVDCAIIHSCDWDTHVVKARPFIEAGKAVLIDKPIAGRLSDLKQLCSWADNGARISGGSALLYCDEIMQWRAQPVEKRGEPQMVFCGCGVDDFNYGIHAYAMLCAIMGTGVRSVRHIGHAKQRLIRVSMLDGRQGMLCVGQTPKWLPFYATIVTDVGVTHLHIDHTKLYESLLRRVVPYLSGESATPPLPVTAWIEPEQCALAARQSWLNGDVEVRIDEIDQATSYDGTAFADSYRAAKYPAS